MPDRTLAAALTLACLAAPSPARAQAPDPARFREVFVQLDQNGDTVLERDEIPEAGRDAFDRLLKRGDANKNGKLEADEMRALGRKLAPLADPATLAARFRGMDTDQDGKVARAEFTGVPENFDRIDSDKDGVLSKAEVDSWVETLSSAMPGPGGARPKAKGKAKIEAPAKPESEAPAKPEAKTPDADPAAGPCGGSRPWTRTATAS